VHDSDFRLQRWLFLFTGADFLYIADFCLRVGRWWTI
jgi:hypothetical protein